MNVATQTNHTKTWAHRYVDLLRHRAGLIIAAALFLTLVSAMLASRLQLKTDFAELLPSHDSSVQELRRVQQALPGMEALLVNVYAPDATSNRRFADDLVSRLKALPASTVGLVTCHIKEERAFFAAHQGLYVALPDLQTLEQLLSNKLAQLKNPLALDLSDEPLPQTGETLEQLFTRLQTNRDSTVGPHITEHFADGYLATRDGKTVSVVILPPNGMFHEHAGESLRNLVYEIVESLNPASYGVTEVGYSGDIESSLEERASLENDLIWATSLCVALVCLIVTLFFGRLRAIPLMAIPATIGTLVSYAVASVAFGYLNSSTAFLASIIVGNGVNFAIIQLARYDEERALGASAAEALARAVGGTVKATGIAAVAAALSYGSLTLTLFRGFSQFGVIGGVGMLVAWLATLVVLPAVIWLLDRRPRKARAKLWFGGAFVAEHMARWVLRAPWVWVFVAVLLSVFAAVHLPAFLRDPFEYNFRNLRSAMSDNKTAGEARWYDANAEVFGRALNPFVVLTHSRAALEPTRQALWRADSTAGGPPMLEKIVSLDDLLPGSVASQQEKLPVLQKIRTILTDPAWRRLKATERNKLTAYIPPSDIQPITAQDLPLLVRRPFTLVDGTLGNVLLVFPKLQGYDPWDGRDMMRLSARVSTIDVLPNQQEHAVGAAGLFTGMIRSITRDGPLATFISALGVSLLVVLLLRQNWGGALLVIGTLASGVLWMVGTAAWLDLRINFLNFVALPVTLGIGVDYGINIYVRASLEGPGRLRHALAATGGAVALCSATTIIGYAALLVADNRGLRSFGTLAILGEVACLLAALILMPACLALKEKRLNSEQS